MGDPRVFQVLAAPVDPATVKARAVRSGGATAGIWDRGSFDGGCGGGGGGDGYET